MNNEEFNPNETMTRKEYLKKKRKEQNKNRKFKFRFKKSTVILSGIFLVLGIYVCSQLYIYKIGQQKKFTKGDGIDEDVYGAYYVVPSYTYDTNYSVSYVKTNGDNEKVILENTAFSNIIVDNTHIYGVRKGILYRLNKSTLNIEEIVNGGVDKFIKVKDRLLIVTGNEKDGGKVESVNLDGTDRKEIYDKYAFQIVGNNDGIYVIANEESARNIVKIGMDGTGKTVLVKSSSSNLILNDEYVFFANKSDGNKLYRVSRNNSADIVKLSEYSAVADTGVVKYVNGKKVIFVKDKFVYYINASDGYKLYKVDFLGQNESCVLDIKLDTVTLKGSIVFYTSKNEMGFCSYNLDTGLMKQISNKRISEFTITETEDETN